MSCCRFIPALPSFNATVEVYKWNTVSEQRERELPDLVGQIQSQQQTADEGERATSYLRYSKSTDRLRDYWDYGATPAAGELVNTDGVAFNLPGGRKVYYLVREVQSKHLGFPNEHLVATLVKVNETEFAGGGGGGEGTPVHDGDLELTTGTIPDGTCNECSSLEGGVHLFWANIAGFPLDWNSAGIIYNCDSEDSAFWRLKQTGDTLLTLTLLTMPSVTTRATYTANVEDWNPAGTEFTFVSGDDSCEWPATVEIATEGGGSPPMISDPDSWTLDATAVADGTCTDSAGVAVLTTINRTDPSTLISETLPNICGESGPGTQWLASIDDDADPKEFLLDFVDIDSVTLIARYHFDWSAWTGGALEGDYVEDNGSLTWPATLTMTPD